MADHESSSAALGDISAEASIWFDQHWDPSLSLGEWWSMLAHSGWGFPQWPTGRFGRSLSSEAAAAVEEKRHEAGAVGPPKDGGTMLAAPTLLRHGSEAQLDRYLPGIATGTERWCQLFSEPGAGSDLAALRTSALRDGDTWIINGQKVWTSGAQEAHYGLLLARTNAAVPKHRGISYFVIDMAQPGVEVRPLREMTGRAAFNEVFLTDATVSNDDLVRRGKRGMASGEHHPQRRTRWASHVGRTGRRQVRHT